MNIPPDAAELKALWNKGYPALPLSAEVHEKVMSGLQEESHWIGRLNAARLAGVIDWPKADREEVVTRLLNLRKDDNRFVRPWALSTLWRMVEPEDPRRMIVEEWVDDALVSASSAERARARILLSRDIRPIS